LFLLQLTSLNNDAYNYYRQQIAAAGPGGFFVLVIGDRIMLVIVRICNALFISKN